MTCLTPRTNLFNFIRLIRFSAIYHNIEKRYRATEAERAKKGNEGVMSFDYERRERGGIGWD